MSVIVQNVVVTVLAVGALALMVRRMLRSSRRKRDATAMPCARCAAHEHPADASQRAAAVAGSMNTERAVHAVLAVESHGGSPRGPVPSGRPGTTSTTASR